ncbi:vWA domain-containing protein [Bifidobacterium aerophilum]|uniref:VWA domain-containing protein n=1 Tax=Bifidobacterium aerophilum TaxID=1798155 RepID=A0A6N9Z349_9BIFI|nr:VWA domain-containing protein [Bifidobacterium aerophilum]NEG88625.1 VWA domain-containing protein [Bifidobacterium aerophilum]
MHTATLAWQWPWAALAGVLAALAVIILVAVLSGAGRSGRAATPDEAPVFSLDDDLATEHAAKLLRRWRAWNRVAVALLAAATILAVTLIARPSTVDVSEERASRRDIVLCLDVSGSTLPYDREVIETYLNLVSNFQGERIGLSIFNSTSRTVFPLTDDYDLVTGQLKSAAEILKGVETQDDIDKMSDEQYQKISDWLEGTQNRTNATSLIGDGVVSCAAMLPGFAYGTPSGENTKRQRAASIVLATDNVVSGDTTYTLTEALDLVSKAGITVDGLFSGPRSSESDETTTDMKNQIETHGGLFLTQSNGASVNQLVREIDARRQAASQRDSKAAVTDTPGWWTLALVVLAVGWMVTAWRLRR